MSVTHSSRESENTAVETLALSRKKNAHFDKERWQVVLDDPSFRRLLRDGHQAETTTFLLAQLEDDE